MRERERREGGRAKRHRHRWETGGGSVDVDQCVDIPIQVSQVPYSRSNHMLLFAGTIFANCIKFANNSTYKNYNWRQIFHLEILT